MCGLFALSKFIIFRRFEHEEKRTGREQAQPFMAPEQIIQKDGYLYIYVSNESAQNVFFDNLVIHHNRGPILQTDNYYPFGLTMAGISDEAALSLENNYLFNGKLLNHKEFSDNTGLHWYSYGMREYDPQIGRFFRVDPLANKFPYLTPYQYAPNDPILNIDIDGLEGLNVNLPILQPSDATIVRASTPTMLPSSSAATGARLMPAEEANVGYTEPAYKEGSIVEEYKMDKAQDGEYVSPHCSKNNDFRFFLIRILGKKSCNACW